MRWSASAERSLSGVPSALGQRIASRCRIPRAPRWGDNCRGHDRCSTRKPQYRSRTVLLIRGGTAPRRSLGEDGRTPRSGAVIPVQLWRGGVWVALAASCACSRGDVRGRAIAVSPDVAARLDSLMKTANAVYLGSTDSAATLWVRALPLADSIGDSLSRATILTSLGGAAWRNSDYSEAKRLLE